MSSTFVDKFPEKCGCTVNMTKAASAIGYFVTNSGFVFGVCSYCIRHTGYKVNLYDSIEHIRELEKCKNAKGVEWPELPL